MTKAAAEPQERAFDIVRETVIERPFPEDGPSRRAWCLAHAVSFQGSLGNWGRGADDDVDPVERVIGIATRFLAFMDGG